MKVNCFGKVEWKLKNDHSYEAEFRLNGVEVAAKFDANGKWLETETTIARTKLPPDVRATRPRCAADLSGQKLTCRQLEAPT